MGIYFNYMYDWYLVKNQSINLQGFEQNTLKLKRYYSLQAQGTLPLISLLWQAFLFARQFYLLQSLMYSPSPSAMCLPIRR